MLREATTGVGLFWSRIPQHTPESLEVYPEEDPPLTPEDVCSAPYGCSWHFIPCHSIDITQQKSTVNEGKSQWNRNGLEPGVSPFCSIPWVELPPRQVAQTLVHFQPLTFLMLLEGGGPQPLANAFHRLVSWFTRAHPKQTLTSFTNHSPSSDPLGKERAWDEGH